MSAREKDGSEEVCGTEFFRKDFFFSAAAEAGEDMILKTNAYGRDRKGKKISDLNTDLLDGWLAVNPLSHPRYHRADDANGTPTKELVKKSIRMTSE